RSFERDLQEQAIDNGKAQVLQIEIRCNGGIFVAGERDEGLFCFAGNERVDADDCVLCCDLLIRHFDRAVFVEHNLKTIDGLRPGEILNVAVRFGYVPRDDHAILEFLCVASAGHPRLEKDANGGNRVDYISRTFRQLIEARDGDSALIARRERGISAAGEPTSCWRAESNRACNADGKRIPRLAGKWKREV